MKTKNDQSFGVVPIHKNGDQYEVFVLNQISFRKDIYWTFPKGHPEENEGPVEAALRELEEESGLEADLITERKFEQSYSFTHEDTLINKSVTYFIGLVKDKDYSLQPEEVAAAKWCTFREAQDLLTHDLAKKTLQEVEDYLFDNIS